MIKIKKDVVVIGGGPAGLAAAAKVYDNGIKDVMLIERDFELGGIYLSVFIMVLVFIILVKS